MGLNKSLRNHQGKKKQLCIIPGPASFWNRGILRNKLVISCKGTRREKAQCRLIGVFTGRSHSLQLTPRWAPHSQEVSQHPALLWVRIALLWLGAGLEEGRHSQNSVCHAEPTQWVHLTSGISPGTCPCCQGVGWKGPSPFCSSIRFPSWALDHIHGFVKHQEFGWEPLGRFCAWGKDPNSPLLFGRAGTRGVGWCPLFPRVLFGEGKVKQFWGV